MSATTLVEDVRIVSQRLLLGLCDIPSAAVEDVRIVSQRLLLGLGDIPSAAAAAIEISKLNRSDPCFFFKTSRPDPTRPDPTRPVFKRVESDPQRALKLFCIRLLPATNPTPAYN